MPLWAGPSSSLLDTRPGTGRQEEDEADEYHAPLLPEGKGLPPVIRLIPNRV